MTAIKFLEPDSKIISRRNAIIECLYDLLPDDCVIEDERELKPFETDAFTAYRRMPLASLAGGAIPQEDAIVIGVSKMTKLLEVDFDNRVAIVEAGATNLSISDAVSNDGFFYAPDPSSQLACTIGGNIGMNSGGAHCLKYGVTTNNLLGVKLLGIVTEATVRLIAKPAGARPVLFGFDDSEVAGACVADIIGSGIIPVAIEFMDKHAIDICESFAHAGYPMDVQALLIIEG
ncbi:Glycolate oxidase subunit GlcD [Nymphon striatum]|nr:Glycolate oxidase subunit GlcD [Nymphon striatum]